MGKKVKLFRKGQKIRFNSDCDCGGYNSKMLFKIRSVRSVPTRCTCGNKHIKNKIFHRKDCGIHRREWVGHPQWVIIMIKEDPIIGEKGLIEFSGACFIPA